MLWLCLWIGWSNPHWISLSCFCMGKQSLSWVHISLDVFVQVFHNILCQSSTLRCSPTLWRSLQGHLRLHWLLYFKLFLPSFQRFIDFCLHNWDRFMVLIRVQLRLIKPVHFFEVILEALTFKYWIILGWLTLCDSTLLLFRNTFKNTTFALLSIVEDSDLAVSHSAKYLVKLRVPC